MDSTQWDQRYTANELVWSVEPNIFLREILGPCPPAKVLDLACGEGRNAIWLAEHGWDVTAADFSQVAIDKATALAAQRDVHVSWTCADATRDRVGTDFDQILICYLQLPPQELHAALRIARDCLTPHGSILVIAHARDNLTHGVGGPQDPDVVMAADEVAQLLQRIDPHFVVDRCEHRSREVTTPEGIRQAIDLIVQAHLGELP
jgi:SAM-dependent methyltransferase